MSAALVATAPERAASARILRAATALFRARGYHGSSMRTLARGLRMEPASLYYHFPSKQDILFAILDRTLDDLLDGLRHAVTAADDDRDGIATVTLDRPEKNNAISMEMRADFRALADELYTNESVRVAIITGGGKAFSVGADVSTFETDWNTPVFRANTRLLTNFFNELEALEKPVIAAINGTCVGGGLELAMACDLRVAARSARFGLPENNLGLIPGVGGCSRLVKLVGFGRAKELVLTGEIITAEDAFRHGLVNRVVDDGALAAEARALAERLRGKAPQALGIAKRVLQNCVSADLQTGRTIESFGQSILIKTKDHREGVTAFREKRRPKFEGR